MIRLEITTLSHYLCLMIWCYCSSMVWHEAPSQKKKLRHFSILHASIKHEGTSSQFQQGHSACHRHVPSHLLVWMSQANALSNRNGINCMECRKEDAFCHSEPQLIGVWLIGWTALIRFWGGQDPRSGYHWHKSRRTKFVTLQWHVAMFESIRRVIDKCLTRANVNLYCI